MACWLCRNEIDEVHYQHIDDQHPDSLPDYALEVREMAICMLEEPPF